MSTPTATADATPLAERPTTSERILRVASWLVEGKLRPECVALAMKEWQLSRRTAQIYVARAARRIGRMTTYEDPLFAMKLGQIQRDLLYQELQNLLRGGEYAPLPQWQMKIKAIQTTLKVLDSRDRTAARIAQMEAKTRPLTPNPSPLSTGESSPVSPGARGDSQGPGPQMLREGKAATCAAKRHPDWPKSPGKAQAVPASPPLAPTPRRQCQPDLASSLRSFAARPAAQATEDIAIVPSPRKPNAAKDLRPAATTAPGVANCALESKEVVDMP
jgi:hypothetical protein